MIEEFVWEKATPTEFFVSGVLVLLALIICVASFSLGGIEEILIYINQYQSLPVSVLLGIIFVAVAYAVGVFSDVFAREIFEWKFDEIKTKSMKKYLIGLEKDNVDLAKSPILKKIKGIDPNNIAKEQLRGFMGHMRSYVLKESPGLYQDIASQLQRLRLVRVMFLVEVILIVAIIIKLFHEVSFLLMGALVFFILTAFLSVMVIYDRFQRYCRATERSYRVLVFDRYGEVTKVPSQTYHKMKIKRENTEKAHQQYQNPLVGIIVFLSKEKEIAVFEQANGTWSLPEKYARGDEWLKEAVCRTLSDYVDCQHVTIESCTLLSGGNDQDPSHPHDQEIPYQFNYVAVVRMNNSKTELASQPKWISKDDLEDNTPGKPDYINIYFRHEELLKEYFKKGHLKDDITVPADLSARSEPDKPRLEKTREIHAENFPMPSITVDGLLLKFSEQCEFQGIILERRSKKVDREPGKWAFIGGFVRAHERMSEALAREVREEVGITLKENQFLSVYKHGTGPYRDPRWLVWTQFLVVYTMEEPTVEEKKEIDEVGVFPPHKIPYDEMAFDHGDVVKEFMSSLPSYIKCVEERENECPP